MKTLCVDGNSILKVSFFGNKNTFVNDQNIGALFTMLTLIRKILKEYGSFDRCILFWDSINEAGKLRFHIYEGYKANRPHKSWYSKIELTEDEIKKEQEKDKSILTQRIRIKNYAEELFFRQVDPHDGIEADDCIAYYCLNKRKNEEIIIFSGDHDFCQLIDKDISLYLTRKRTLINKLNYFLFFNHHLSNACLVKSIVGDQSDNIPGIPGIQEKTLLKCFPQLKKRKVEYEELIEWAKEIQEKRKEEKKEPLKNLQLLIEGKELYELYKKIIDLHNPILTDECKELIKDINELPLDDENRGSKNLLRMMTEDGFISLIWNEDYVDYLEPFFSVINSEKEYLKKYE